MRKLIAIGYSVLVGCVGLTTELDASVLFDGGSSLVDSGSVSSDAGLDAGTDGSTSDSGVSTDAGLADAGVAGDAGSGSDAGASPDAGSPSAADLHVVSNFYNTSTTDVQNGYVEEDFKLFWYSPVRAYPGLELRHQFIVYEAFNQPLSWAITDHSPTTNPMALSSDGVFTWTPAASEMGSSVSVTIRVSRPTAGTKPAVRSIDRTFRIAVGTSDFFFVSTTGDDHNAGTFQQPLRTVRAALSKVASGPGKTIYVRSGTYEEYSCNPTDPSATCSGVSPLSVSHAFTAESPLIIGTMPGDPTRFVLNCASKGWGLSLSGSYTVLQDAEVENATVSPTDPFEANPGALGLAGNNNIAEHVSVHDSNWSPRQNVTGVLVQFATGAVLDRVDAADNMDKTPNQLGNSNSSNFLFYTEPPAKGPIYVLNCSSARSVNGYKVKHPGVESYVLIHRSSSLNDQAGYQIADDFSSIRYSFAIESYGHGIAIGPSEASLPGHDNDMLIEHDTIVNNGGAGLYFATNYIPRGLVVAKNIVYQGQQVAFSPYYENNDYPASRTALFGELWVYQADVSNTSATLSKNVYFAHEPYAHDFFRLSSTYYATFADWQRRGYDLDSKVADPLFVDLVHFALKPGSPAVFGAGEFAGAR